MANNFDFEAALNAEIENYLEENPKPSNHRNGYSRKSIKSCSGSFELETPRDRTGDFEPQLVKKNQTKLSDDIDNKVISLFTLGKNYRDIKKYIVDMYGLDISEGAITHIIDKLIPKLRAWQQRPLDAVYRFDWLDAIYYKIDAIYYKIKAEDRYINKAFYSVLRL